MPEARELKKCLHTPANVYAHRIGASTEQFLTQIHTTTWQANFCVTVINTNLNQLNWEMG